MNYAIQGTATHAQAWARGAPDAFWRDPHATGSRQAIDRIPDPTSLTYPESGRPCHAVAVRAACRAPVAGRPPAAASVRSPAERLVASPSLSAGEPILRGSGASFFATNQNVLRR